ncbi:MAG: aminopeptidase N [Chloroflexi bacterium]|nr:aminopeptidase N [Chloroflexota bacterium]
MTTITSPARDVLTQVEAESRAARVSNTTYDLALSLTRGSDSYQGEVTIRFDLTGEGDLFLDARGKRIDVLEVNGRAVTPDWNGYRLTLPGSALAAQNTVHIVYENFYDHTGDGLHQFIDPEDGQEYVYTNFEPYESHRLFPGFDQPDIKATYALTVTAPEDWEVIANSREISARPTGDGRTVRTFETTKRFSTYLFAMIAGPYQVFRDEHNGIPLGLFCRKSLAKYLDTDELFELSKQGLDFFSEFFAYPYPFGKYDQVFVPEFNAGAMENVAAVTHSEHYVFRDPPTDNQRRVRADTLLHEMAHMWFGNLTTMKWWNDLWLNESFASYMSCLALVEATRFTDSWVEFSSGMKAWAYRQDQLVTTHPIAGQVADTDQTFLNFDGITYGKGASVLKQLVATIGIDGFREGMRRYFQRHAFSNATLSQFLDALEEGSGRELHDWARLWLETPSLNTIAASWERDGDRIANLSVTQTAPAEYPTLRPHAIEIALVREQDGALAVDALPFQLDGPEAEVSEARGRPAPTFVFPNYNDQGYGKFALDPESLAYVREHLERVTDPLLRQLIWGSLWDMVRDQQLKSTDFLTLAGDKVRSETDLELIETIIQRCMAALGRYVPDSVRKASFHDFFQVAWAMLRAAPQGDAQIIWARALIGVAINPEDLVLAMRLADGDESVPGLEIDQDMRWDIAVRAVILGMDGAAGRVEVERGRDPSDRGQRMLLRAETARPDLGVKEAAWERFHGDGYGSLHLTAAAMSGFNSYAQRPMLMPFLERFFARVTEVFETRDKEFTSSYFNNLFPGFRTEQAVLDRSEQLLAEVGDRLPLLTRMLREANDDLSRALKCRAYAENG